MLAREYQGQYDLLAEYLENRLSSYLEPVDVSEPPDGVPRAAYNYFPFPGTFGGKFPAIGASEIGSDGQSQFGDTYDMPGVVEIGWRCYYPSMARPDKGRPMAVRRVYARQVTRKVFAAFRAAFFADAELESKVLRMELGRVEMGDHDRFGNPYEEVTTQGQTYLWVLGCTARFHL